MSLHRRALLRGLPGGAVLGLFTGLGGLAGCAGVQTEALRRGPLAGLPDSVDLAATPFFPQTAYQCGPAALATALGAVGIVAPPEQLAERIFLPARQGSLQIEVIAGARRSGAVATVLPGELAALLRELAAGQVVLVLQNLGLDIAPVWHYAVLVGYSLARQEVVLRSGTTQREAMRLATFEHTWVRAGSWAIAVLPPGRWPVAAQPRAVVDAAVGFERNAPAAQALKAYASATQRWPDELALAMGLGNTAFAAGQKVLAAEAFSSVARRHRSAPAWINLGHILLDAGLPESAWRAAREAETLADPAWRSETAALLREVAAQRSALASAPSAPSSPAVAAPVAPAVPAAPAPASAARRRRRRRQAKPSSARR